MTVEMGRLDAGVADARELRFPFTANVVRACAADQAAENGRSA